MVFITPFLKSKRLEALLRQFFVLSLLVFFAGMLRPVMAAELTQLSVERGDDGRLERPLVLLEVELQQRRWIGRGHAQESA